MEAEEAVVAPLIVEEGLLDPQVSSIDKTIQIRPLGLLPEQQRMYALMRHLMEMYRVQVKM